MVEWWIVHRRVAEGAKLSQRLDGRLVRALPFGQTEVRGPLGLYLELLDGSSEPMRSVVILLS